MNKDYYEPRHIIKSSKKNLNFYFDDNNNFKTLEDNIFEYDKIVLLGNPGIGKSRELQNLFTSLWDKIDINGIVPFSINLKNFRPINKFEDLLGYEDWESLSQIIFILDGLDEIAEISDFLSAFEIFLNQHKLSNYKYVISCRTNIFEKYLVNISEFDTFYLKDLNFNQSDSILKNKFDINLEELYLLDKHYQYLKSPFFLNLFAEYYKSEKKLPDSDAIMWEIYVIKHLENHKKKIVKQRFLDVPQEIKNLKKIAFVNELQQKNFITSTELNALIGPDYVKLTETPFFINLENEHEKFSFEHRQLQEYFVAKTLSEKEFHEILSIANIGSVNKVHPTLFNAISFLINLMQDNKSRNQLIDWIEKNQIELIIKADSDRINEPLRIRVFQKYFIDRCIEKTYWITTDRNFSIDEIAEFADCQVNFEFLINIIKDRNIQFRARISALSLLGYFNNIPMASNDFFKSFLIDNLKASDNSKQIKSAMLQCISKKRFTIDDEDYLKKLLEIFKSETSKEINVELLKIINGFEDIDKYAGFIKEEFLRENNIEPRDEKDEVVRGNSYILSQLILKLRDIDKFIDLAKYFFDYRINVNIYSGDLEDLIEKCVEFDKNDNEFIIKLLKQIDIKTRNFYLDRPLQQLISKIDVKSINGLSKYILENFDFQNTSYLLSTLMNKDNIWYVIDKFKIEDVELKEIEYFRNALVKNSDKNLAKLFNDEMIKKGFEFNTTLLSEEEILKIKEAYENKHQKNFDLLFDKELLLKEFENLFNENGEKISAEMYYEINENWYFKNGHGNIIDGVIEMLGRLIHNFSEQIELSDVKEQIDNDDFIIEEIKYNLQNDRKVSKIIVSKLQKEFIEKWVQKAVKEINFNLIVRNNSSGYSFLDDYTRWEYVIYFARFLDFILPQEFLLNSLAIPDVKKYNDDKTLFDYLKEKIEDEKDFDSEIENNLKKDNLSSFVVDKYIEYVIAKPLKSSLKYVRIQLLKEDREYNLEKKLYNFYKLERDVAFLKECSVNINSYKSWDAISVLMQEKIEQSYCISKAIEYLEKISLNLDLDRRFISNSLNVLFELNHIEAIRYYFLFLNVDLYASANSNYFANYDAIEDYRILESLFEKIYLNDEFDRAFNNSITFLNQYVFNLSKNPHSYQKVQAILLDIRSKLIESNNSNGIFNINLLIDNSNNSYYIAESSPLTFSKACEKVNEIVN